MQKLAADFWGFGVNADVVCVSGKSTPLQGYEGFVDVSKKIMQGRTAVEQRAVVRNVLLSLLPPGAPAQVIL